MTQVNYDGLVFEWPTGWLDVTADLPAGSPLTLARPAGSGVIQFSLVQYVSGRDPKIEACALVSLLEAFCLQHGLDVSNVAEKQALMICVGAHGVGNRGTFLAAWYVSNGKDVIFVTYLSTQIYDRAIEVEYEDAGALVRTIEYWPLGEGPWHASSAGH